MTSEPPLTDFHPCDPDDARDPYDRLAGLRSDCPIARLLRPGLPDVTLVTRYDDVREIFKDYRTFGNIGFFPSMAVHEMTPEPRPIIHLDRPEHTDVRRLILLAMKPAAVAVSLPRTAERAAEFVAAMVGTGTGEWVADLAVPLPAEAIASVLGLPVEDAPTIHRWIATLFSEPPAGQAPSPAGLNRQLDEAFDVYLDDQIAQRRDGTIAADDAITRMIAYERADGTRFSDAELRVHIRTLLMAGNETTTSLLSNMVYRMLSEGDVQARLRADRSLVEPFIEECLRYDAPLTQFPRRCRHATSIGGVELRESDVVSLSMPSANRDESAWGEDADEFRVDRFTTEQPGHLSFGLGIHLCIGADLARKTAHIALTALLDRTSRVELAPGYEFEKVWFFEFWRPQRLDLVLTA